jgi:endoglucanase
MKTHSSVNSDSAKLEIETATRYTFFLLQVDFKYYLAPEYYEQYITNPEWQHPAFYLSPDFPSGEIAGQSSAAMAVGALVFKEFDSAYADSLIVHAKV